MFRSRKIIQKKDLHPREYAHAVRKTWGCICTRYVEITHDSEPHPFRNEHMIQDPWPLGWQCNCMGDDINKPDSQLVNAKKGDLQGHYLQMSKVIFFTSPSDVEDSYMMNEGYLVLTPLTCLSSTSHLIWLIMRHYKSVAIID